MMGFVKSIITAHLPEGKFKELLRRYYYRRYNYLYALNKIISRADLLQDGTAFVELNDGTKFYGQQDKTSAPWIKRGDPQKLGIIRDFYHFGGFLRTLYNQYVTDIYEEYYKLEKGDIVVDMGAHIGTFAVKAAKAVSDNGRVLAIEPEVNNLKLLEKNIEVNRLQNVTIVPRGAWSEKGKTKLYLSALMTAHSLSIMEDENKFEEVELDTLDNILKELGIKRVDFIKMNIEGAEIEALKGMERTLRDNDCKLVVVAHIVNGKEIDEIVASHLRERRFEVIIEGRVHRVYARKRA